MVIGTGSITGVYYSTGGAIAKIVNQDANINTLMDVNGEGEWEEDGPQEKLRAIFSVHPESVALIASDESGIQSIQDLIGKKVNLGNPGSGQLYRIC
ncbi:C4-dicarboxylate ABC transporter substrate-binding protein [Candidatus Magnetomorum sp. HK-1]|nr:C4-dicarboxylate ABC transporter substrate-binding protein [Candidatus Magnetomorum sp. HK-1]